jgi:hypothetical protein
LLIFTSVISKRVEEYNAPYLRRMLNSHSPPKIGEFALPSNPTPKGGARPPVEPMSVKTV